MHKAASTATNQPTNQPTKQKQIETVNDTALDCGCFTVELSLKSLAVVQDIDECQGHFSVSPWGMDKLLQGFKLLESVKTIDMPSRLVG